MKWKKIGWPLLKSIYTHPLSEGRRLGALLAALGFKLRTLCARGVQQIEWIDDCALYVGKGDYSLSASVYFGLSDFEEMGFLLHVARPGDVFVDIGANLGGWTILASGAVGCETVSVEPVESTFSRLVEQIEANHLLSNVVACNFGIAEMEGELGFTTDLGTTNHVAQIGECGSVETVTVTRLDNLKIESGRRVHLKIDTEGYEMKVLRSGEKLLNSGEVSTVIVETNNYGAAYGHSNEEIHLFLHGLGFRKVNYNPLTRQLTVVDQVRPIFSDNSIYISDINGAREVVRQAKEYKIHTAGGILL